MTTEGPRHSAHTLAPTPNFTVTDPTDRLHCIGDVARGSCDRELALLRIHGRVHGGQSGGASKWAPRWSYTQLQHHGRPAGLLMLLLLLMLLMLLMQAAPPRLWRLAKRRPAGAADEAPSRTGRSEDVHVWLHTPEGTGGQPRLAQDRETHTTVGRPQPWGPRNRGAHKTVGRPQPWSTHNRGTPSRAHPTHSSHRQCYHAQRPLLRHGRDWTTR